MHAGMGGWNATRRRTGRKDGQVIAEARGVLGGTGVLLGDTVMRRMADLEALLACEVTTAPDPGRGGGTSSAAPPCADGTPLAAAEQLAHAPTGN